LVIINGLYAIAVIISHHLPFNYIFYNGLVKKLLLKLQGRVLLYVPSSFPVLPSTFWKKVYIRRERFSKIRSDLMLFLLGCA
jgi:hypothetical protein